MHLCHINSDFVRTSLFKTPVFSLDENEIVFKTMDLLAEQALQAGQSIIYDGNITRPEYRKRIYNLAIKHGAKPFLLWLQTPMETSLQRIRERRNKKSKSFLRYNLIFDASVVKRIKGNMIEPKNEPVILLDGTASYKEQKRLILRAARARRPGHTVKV
jgi:predicted kinase